jgi:SAM-dependent methyltransferase
LDNVDPNSLYTDGRYLENNPGWHVADSAWKAKRIIAAVREANINPRSICDIGCGAGEVIRCLAQQLPDCEFHGYELSPQAYELAKSRETENCRFFHLDGFEAPQRDQYDIAMAIDVVEHVEDYFGFLRKLKQIGIHKILHVPLEMSALGVLVNQPTWARQAAGHLHYFSAGTLSCALSECGFVRAKVIYTDSFNASLLHWPSGPRKARHAIKVASLFAPRQLLYALNPGLCARLLGGCSAIALCE